MKLDITLDESQLQTLFEVGRELVPPGTRKVIVCPAIVYERSDFSRYLWTVFYAYDERDGYTTDEVMLGNADEINRDTARGMRCRILAGIEATAGSVEAYDSELEAARAIAKHFPCSKSRRVLSAIEADSCARGMLQ